MFTPEIIKEFHDIDLRIYEYLITNALIVPYMTIRELAQEVEVSTTSIMRFIKKLGFDSFSEFKYKYKEMSKENTKVTQAYDFNEVIDCLSKFNSPFYVDRFNSATEIIGNADFVAFLGIGNSGSIGKYGARRFSSAGIFAMSVDDPYLRVSQMHSNGVVIALSVSGETPEVIREINQFKGHGLKVISITTTETSTIAKLSDVTIPYYIHKHAAMESVDITTQMPAVGIIENLARMCFTK